MGMDSANVEARLYKLVLYEEGGFFKPHKDTEKEQGMFATLVVQLPVSGGHEGGELVVRHCGERKKFDWSADSHLRTFYTAFFADCEHELLEVKRGSRACLLYNLVHTSMNAPPPCVAAGADDARMSKRRPTAAGGQDHLQCELEVGGVAATTTTAVVTACVANCEIEDGSGESGVNSVVVPDYDLLGAATTTTFGGSSSSQSTPPRASVLEERELAARLTRAAVIRWEAALEACEDDGDSVPAEKLMIPLEHEYTKSGLSFKGLKGADAAKVAALRGARNCVVNLGLITKSVTGDPECSSYSQYHTCYKFTAWVSEDGKKWKRRSSRKVNLHRELLAGVTNPFKGRKVDEKEREGYMGNEGPTESFFYHVAFAVVWPRSRDIVMACRGNYMEGIRRVRKTAETSGAAHAKVMLHQVLQFASEEEKKPYHARQHGFAWDEFGALLTVSAHIGMVDSTLEVMGMRPRPEGTDVDKIFPGLVAVIDRWKLGPSSDRDQVYGGVTELVRFLASERRWGPSQFADLVLQLWRGSKEGGGEVLRAMEEEGTGYGRAYGGVGDLAVTLARTVSSVVLRGDNGGASEESKAVLNFPGSHSSILVSKVAMMFFTLGSASSSSSGVVAIGRVAGGGAEEILAEELEEFCSRAGGLDETLRGVIWNLVDDEKGLGKEETLIWPGRRRDLMDMMLRSFIERAICGHEDFYYYNKRWYYYLLEVLGMILVRNSEDLFGAYKTALLGLPVVERKRCCKAMRDSQRATPSTVLSQALTSHSEAVEQLLTEAEA